LNNCNKGVSVDNGSVEYSRNCINSKENRAMLAQCLENIKSDEGGKSPKAKSKQYVISSPKVQVKSKFPQ